MSHPLYIRKLNLKAVIDKEDCGRISRFIQFNQIVDYVYNKIANYNLIDGIYTRSLANKSGMKSD